MEGSLTQAIPSDTAEPVSVVIVSWNSRDYLEACLESLDRLERPVQRTIVVDNGSTDGSMSWLARRFPAVERIELSGNAGFCRANNIGIAHSDTPFVLVLNPDTRLDPAFLRRLLPAFEDAGVGIACGKLLRFDGVTLDSAGQQLARSRQPIDRGYGTLDRGQYDADSDVFGACGAAALYRRTMLDSIADGSTGYFDETFFAFGEDLDLAWRARNRGWRAVYRCGAIGFHARGGSAQGPRWKRRLAAMLGRDDTVRFHIAKNRYLTILRNDSVAGYLLNSPFILARDLGTLALLLVSSPGVLRRLWSERQIFFDVRALRRLDEARPKHQI